MDLRSEPGKCFRTESAAPATIWGQPDQPRSAIVRRGAPSTARARAFSRPGGSNLSPFARSGFREPEHRSDVRVARSDARPMGGDSFTRARSRTGPCLDLLSDL